MGLVYSIRPATAEDWPFMRNSFNRSLSQGGDFGWLKTPAGPGLRDPGWYFQEEITRRLNHMVGGAVVAQGKDELLGWASGDDGWFHYVYVKQFFRGNGIAKALWESLKTPRQATHWTRGAMLNKQAGAFCYWPNYWSEFSNGKVNGSRVLGSHGDGSGSHPDGGGSHPGTAGSGSDPQ